jgi:hypothetical protein
MKKNKSTFRTLSFALALTLCLSCSKSTIQSNIIIDAITNGRWIVDQFKENDQDYTTQFASYEFQFENAGTVTAYKANIATNGTWIPDIPTRTIFAKFPLTNDTLKRLNDTWKVYNNTLTIVEANPTNTGRSAYLKLIKK